MSRNAIKNSLTQFSKRLNDAYEKHSTFTILLGFLILLFAVLYSRGDSASVFPPTLTQRHNSGEVAVGLALFDAALNDGDYSLAEIYLINAIQREPWNMKTITALKQLAYNNPSFDSVALERVVALLESLMFKVSPEDVSKVASLITELSEHASESVSNTNTDIIATDDISDLLELGPQSPIDSQAIAVYVEQLQQFLDNTNGGDLATHAEVETARNSWLFASQIHNSISFIESCLANVESLGKSDRLDSQAAVSVIQAAENALAALWTVPMNKLPNLYQKKVEDYPFLIQQKVDEIAVARSEKSTQIIKNYEKAARAQLQVTKIESRCKALQLAISKIQKEVTIIPSHSVRNDVRTKLDSLATELQNQRQIQFDKYQKFTLNKCVMLAKGFQDEWTVSATDAKNLFNRHKLYEVNQSLLSPEVSRCFNDILQKLFGELGPEETVSMQMVLGDSNRKTKLEDF